MLLATDAAIAATVGVAVPEARVLPLAPDLEGDAEARIGEFAQHAASVARPPLRLGEPAAVREHGTEAFEKCVEQAVPLSRQLIEAAREGCDTQSAEGRAKLLATARPWWNALPDGALKMQLLGDLAAAAALTPTDLGRL